MTRLGKVLTLLICLLGSPFAYAVTPDDLQPALKKQYIDDCLTTSKSKYELYAFCIGKMAKACVEEPKRFKSALEDMTFPRVEQNCVLLESILWQTAYEEQSASLIERSREKLSKPRAQELEETISNLPRRSYSLCDSFFTNFSDSKKDNALHLLECTRDARAEDAIIVYVWNHSNEIWRRIK